MVTVHQGWAETQDPLNGYVCPRCGMDLMLMMYPARDLEPAGTALVACTDQKFCGWNSGHVRRIGRWTDLLCDRLDNP